MIFLPLIGDTSFPKNMILFFRQEMKDDLSQTETQTFDIFWIFGKESVSLSYKYDINLLSKKQRWHFLEQYISSIIENDGIYPRKHGIYFDRKIKDNKKVYSVKYT